MKANQLAQLELRIARIEKRLGLDKTAPPKRGPRTAEEKLRIVEKVREALARGETITSACFDVDANPAGYYRWDAALRQNGPDGLIPKKSTGRPRINPRPGH